VPTGITPRKKVYNVTTDWERTEPREALIAAMRRGPASLSTTTSTSASTDTLTSEASPIDAVSASTLEMTRRSPSVGSDTENHIVALPPVGLNTSQMKVAKKVELGGMGTKGRTVAPLSEGGANIPRRTRK
jgi:hypothetical protein